MEALWEVVRLAGELVFLDECMADLRWLGLACVCIKIDLGRPLRLEVLVKGPTSPFGSVLCLNVPTGFVSIADTFTRQRSGAGQGKGHSYDNRTWKP